ncbi:hypothetical protein [Planctomycetes bacterium TBK1r]|uniref:Uncharacterized protein n=1 Tax=Stieleria magnilauensis TaxID=2527963 RepID=A0ABX5XYB8_9BACT|nr:hypothetical protein TBK1r_59820 [Planctomycetes bacterium TBK1r]QDV87033.1 hypothetical protein TBK1r_60600 [Planctomycetes bacterium TBK1r]
MTRYIIPAGTVCKIAKDDDCSPYRRHTSREEVEIEYRDQFCGWIYGVIGETVVLVDEDKVRIEE